MARRKNTPADVTHYCWEINAEHPRLAGGVADPRGGRWGGEPVELGQRGPWFKERPPTTSPWGLTQVWRLRNGQEIRVRWKS